MDNRQGVENKAWVVDYFDQTGERQGVGEGLREYDARLPGKISRQMTEGRRRGGAVGFRLNRRK